MIGFIAKKKEILAQMDPYRIYLENVRAFLGTNERIAKKFCDFACRNGIFEEWLSFEHPEYRHVVYETNDLSLDRGLIVIDQTSIDLGNEQAEFKLSELKVIPFYRAINPKSK